MYHTIHFDGKKLLINVQNYIKKHQIIYHTPAYKGYEGLPIGNGDLGVMAWHSRQESLFAINKCDALDYREDGNFGAWAWEEEEQNTAVTSCAFLRISDGFPSFDTLYLKDFSQTLEMGEAVLKGYAKTPFSEWNTCSFVSSFYGCFVMDFQLSSMEEIERVVTLERFGSRNFYHYYETYLDDPFAKSQGTSVSIRDGNLIVVQKQRRNTIAVCAKLVGSACRAEKINSHAARFVLEASKSVTGKVLVSVCCGIEEETIVKQAIDQVEACALAQEEPFHRHKEEWKLFWNKSSLLLEDDYLENLYYFHLYQMNSSSKGSVPALFTGSLWQWNHDIRNWGHFYHWNQQQQYWAMPAAGHCSLMENYLNFRFSMLENAKKDALFLYGSKGAFFSDICNLNGYQALEPDTIRNCTVGAQIAMDFWRYWCYVGDLDFLREKAYPFLRACVDFYMDILTKEDGIFHIKGSTVYESYWPVQDTLTDCVALHELLNATIQAAEILNLDENDVPCWKDVLEHLYLPPTQKLTDGTELFSCAIKWDETPITLGEGSYPREPFTGSVLSPLYPAFPDFLMEEKWKKIAYSTAKTFFTKKVYGNGNDWCGHTPLPQVAARLSMKEDALRILQSYVQQFQPFPNGFTYFTDITASYHDADEVYQTMRLTGQEEGTDWSMLHEKAYGHRVPLPVKEFYHAYNEAGANICAGVQELLLQTRGGIIEVFPALSLEGGNAAFSLYAAGGFQVTSERINGDILYLAIYNARGGTCKVKNPWPNVPHELLCGNERRDVQEEENILTLPIGCGETWLLERCEWPIDTYYKSHFVSKENQNPKKNGAVTLGTFRNF